MNIIRQDIGGHLEAAHHRRGGGPAQGKRGESEHGVLASGYIVL